MSEVAIPSDLAGLVQAVDAPAGGAEAGDGGLGGLGGLLGGLKRDENETK